MTRVPRSHLRPAGQFVDCDQLITEQGYGRVARFVEISSELTGFSQAELTATGLVEAHFDEIRMVIGPRPWGSFLETTRPVPELLADRLQGPIARNVVRLWYLGHWQQLPLAWVKKLPKDWRACFDKYGRNTDRVVSAAAYREGLAWAAIGTHAVGARQAGFGTWEWAP